MPRSRGGPCDVQTKGLDADHLPFLCRVLAAVPATTEAEDAAPFFIEVSMPRSRGGPCDGPDRLRSRQSLGFRFYAAFSRRSLRPRSTRESVVYQLVVSMPRSRGGPCDSSVCKSTLVLGVGFYAAFSRRSLRHSTSQVQRPVR